jgi:hypothetical protein
MCWDIFNLRNKCPNTYPNAMSFAKSVFLLLCEWDSIRVSLFFKVKISQHMYLPLNPNAMSFAKSVFSALM